MYFNLDWIRLSCVCVCETSNLEYVHSYVDGLYVDG